jgi:hypothetical protein
MRSCRSNNTPVAASSNFSAQSCAPVDASARCAATRRLPPARRTPPLDDIANAEVAHRPPRVDCRILDSDHRKSLEARQFRDDVVDQPFDQTRFVRTAAEIGEWHDRDERATRRRTDRRSLRPGQDQPIADTRHGRYPVVSIHVRPEHLAKRCHLDSEIALLDDCAWPGVIDEVILRDDHPSSFEKRIEHEEGALADRKRLPVTFQRCVRQVVSERTERRHRHDRSTPAYSVRLETKRHQSYISLANPEQL